jgi:hypothetical protein
MNQVSKAKTTALEVNYSKIVNKYFNADEATLAEQPVANSNERVKLILFARFVDFFDDWTQNSYDAWEKAGRPEREF